MGIGNKNKRLILKDKTHFAQKTLKTSIRLQSRLYGLELTHRLILRLLELLSHQWQILAIVEGTTPDTEHCPVIDFLDEYGEDEEYASYVDGLQNMLQHAAKHHLPPDDLFTDAQCHEIDKKHRIFQFRRGPLRLLWFYGNDRRVIVCAHAFEKKGQKTPPLDKRRAIDLKKQYQAAHNNNSIEVVKDGD